jgi:hypothetical protein
MLLKIKIKKILNEIAGVPNNLYKTSKEISDKIIFNIDYIEQNINSNKIFLFSKNVILNYDSFKISIFIEFNNNSDFNFIDARTIYEDDENLKSSPKDIIISLNYNINEDFDNLKPLFNDVEHIIAHELKHCYDLIKNNKLLNIKNRIELLRSELNITDIDYVNEFFFYFYYLNIVESLVHPSEVYVKMIKNNTNKNNFYNYLTNNDNYILLNKIEKFSLTEFIEKIKNDDKVKTILYKNNIEYSVDNFLKFIFNLYKGNFVDRFLNDINIKHNKNIKHKDIRDDYKTFFLKAEKRFNSEPRKLKIKLSRLYQLFK